MKNLAFIFLVPLAGALLLRVLPMRKARFARALAVGSSLFSVVGLLLARRASLYQRGDLRFETSWEWMASLGTRLHLGVDSLSFWFGLLAAVVLLVATLSPQAEDLAPDPLRRRLSTLLLLGSGTLGVLMALEMHILFLFYELAVLAMLSIIGAHPEEGRAPGLLRKGLAFAQLLALSGAFFIVYRTVQQGTGKAAFDIGTWSSLVMPQTTQLWGLALLTFAMLAPFALAATVSRTRASWPGAPLVVMALATELFGFGMLRLAQPIFPLACQSAAPILVGLAVAGIAGAAFLVNRRGEPAIWAIRAWAAQPGFILLGVATATGRSTAGAMFQTLAQGLSCAGLYLLVGFLRKHGAGHRIRGLKASLILGFLAAAGAPGLCGFVGEFLIVLGGLRAPSDWQQAHLTALYPHPNIVAILAATAALAYAIGFARVLVRLASDQGVLGKGDAVSLSRNEHLALALVWIGVLGLSVLPGRILSQLESPVASLLMSGKTRSAEARAKPTAAPVHIQDVRTKAASEALRTLFD